MQSLVPGLADCRSLLRRLISAGDPFAIPLAERAIDAYVDIAARSACENGLRLLQQDAWDQHEAAVGVQRSFAETVNAYIERKLAEGCITRGIAINDARSLL
jgi:predicted ATPase